MRTTLLAAVAALSLITATAAYAGEGNGEPFPLRVPGMTTYVPSGTYATDTGSAAYPELAGRPSQVVAAGSTDLLPATGSEGAVQTANSLPRGFEDGTVTSAQAQSVQSYLVQQQARRATQPTASAAASAQAQPVPQRCLFQAQGITLPQVQAQRLVRPAFSAASRSDAGGGRVQSATAAASPAAVACPLLPDPAADAERAANLVRVRFAAEASR